MSNIYDMTDTWNNGATVFTAVKMNVTDTASNASSLLMDLQVGGVSKQRFYKDGTIGLGTGMAFGPIGSGLMFYNAAAPSGYAAYINTSGHINLAPAGAFEWGAGYASDTPDLSLSRVGAGIVKVSDASTGAGVVVTQAVAVASLPSAATAGAGARAFVTDALTTLALGLGTTVANGGANKVPVYSDGTNWKYG